ncbi:DUF4153 domain-containing protein [Dactylosporangium sp. NPDC000521]|uniref:DUF4153 domain-containing protein n=1 Tax=Dactylosporangium sp. NPDC000521 TaxID=3363975 RepID=UPI003686537E
MSSPTEPSDGPQRPAVPAQPTPAEQPVSAEQPAPGRPQPAPEGQQPAPEKQQALAEKQQAPAERQQSLAPRPLERRDSAAAPQPPRPPSPPGGAAPGLRKAPPQPPRPGQPPVHQEQQHQGQGGPRGAVATLAPPVHPQQASNPPQPPPNPALISPVLLGPPHPTLFQRHWPVRSVAAGPGVLIGGLVTAVVAAAALPLDRPGIGWPIAGLALVVALLVVLLRMDPQRRGTSAVEATGWGVATVALLSVGVFRAAGWLFFLCVLAAFGSVALAVGAGRRVPAVFAALVNLPMAGFRSLPWVRSGLRRARAKEGASGAARLLGSIALGVLLLVVFGALFASADAAFDRIVQTILPDLSLSTPFRWLFVGAVAAWLTFGGAFLLHNPSTLGDGRPRQGRVVRWYEWVVPVGAVLTVFGIFVGVQVAVLFGDRDYVMRTAGLTFADYARKGFWQLLVVTLLTLVVIAVTVRKASRETARERALLRVLLGLLSLGALVVVVSALWRMDVYEQAYGFSRLRVLVSAFELWLGGLLVLIMVAGVVPATRWLPRAAVALWVVTLLGLAVLNPDRFIAERNVARFASNNTDVWYLSTLSADAAPALDKLPPGARECALSGISRDLRDEDDWRGWNLGRAEARRIVPEVVDASDYPCYRRY